MKRTVFFVSDGTGITAETVGHALLTQFESFEFERISIPFANTSDRLAKVIDKINQIHDDTGSRPIVFATMSNPEFAQQLIENAKARVFDLFSTYIKPLEAELGIQSSYLTGKSHGLTNHSAYEKRIDAINFTLHHDDGTHINNLQLADIIIIGVSRSGKTPTCIYLAMQYSIKAANYPLTEEDLETSRLPDLLRPFRHNIIGLTIKPERLQRIREQRRPGSKYASINQCRKEVKSAEEMYQIERIPYLDTTKQSIEEIAARIIHEMSPTRQK